jgi:hypothetical protein
MLYCHTLIPPRINRPPLANISISTHDRTQFAHHV